MMTLEEFGWCVREIIENSLSASTVWRLEDYDNVVRFTCSKGDQRWIHDVQSSVIRSNLVCPAEVAHSLIRTWETRKVVYNVVDGHDNVLGRLLAPANIPANAKWSTSTPLKYNGLEESLYIFTLTCVVPGEYLRFTGDAERLKEIPDFVPQALAITLGTIGLAVTGSMYAFPFKRRRDRRNLL